MTQSEENKQPGSYDHTDEHVKVYSMNGVKSEDTPISRAWARLYDSGQNAGPALSESFVSEEEGAERQYFQYAHAVRDLSESNKNKTVVFHFGLSSTSESGL